MKAGILIYAFSRQAVRIAMPNLSKKRKIFKLNRRVSS